MEKEGGRLTRGILFKLGPETVEETWGGGVVGEGGWAQGHPPSESEKPRRRGGEPASQSGGAQHPPLPFFQGAAPTPELWPALDLLSCTDGAANFLPPPGKTSSPSGELPCLLLRTPLGGWKAPPSPAASLTPAKGEVPAAAGGDRTGQDGLCSARGSKYKA